MSRSLALRELSGRTLMNGVAKWMAIPYYRNQLRALQKSLEMARQTQQQSLMRRVQRCSETRFGRDHHFRSIRNVEDFKRQVPIVGYEYLAPYIDQVAEGQWNALFPANEKVIAFSCTTGTTGRPKLNPVTRTWLREFQHSWEIWGVKAICEHSEMIGTRVLQLCGPGELGRTKSGHSIGMVSSIAAKYQNPIYRSFYAVPTGLADINDSDSKYYSTLRVAIVSQVGFVIGITPNNLIRLARIGDEYRDQLIRDLYDGTLSNQFDVPKHLREQISRVVRVKRPDRARFLEKVIEQTGSLYPKDYWPVSLTSCWLGGTVGYQSGELSRYYGKAPSRDLGLVSTEGRHTVPLEDGKPEGVLAVDGAFYEFVPAGNDIGSTAETLQCHELDVGQEYSLIMTTSSGLYRYEIGDVVRCTGYIGQTPVLEFLQKSGQCSDMEGEKLSGSQFAHAVEVASRELSMTVDTFTAVPVRSDGQTPYYALLLEKPCLKDRLSAQSFIRIVDRELIRQNVMYAGKRNDRYIESPRILCLAAGTWKKFTESETRANRTGDTQYKQAALVPSTSWLDRFEPVDSIRLETVESR